MFSRVNNPSVVVQRLGYLAFTQETRVRFPATELLFLYINYFMLSVQKVYSAVMLWVARFLLHKCGITFRLWYSRETLSSSYASQTDPEPVSREKVLQVEPRKERRIRCSRTWGLVWIVTVLLSSYWRSQRGSSGEST